MWSIENRPNLLQGMCDQGLIELIDDTYKIKQTEERELVEETLTELTSQCPPFSETETQISPELLSLRKSLSTLELPSP